MPGTPAGATIIAQSTAVNNCYGFRNLGTGTTRVRQSSITSSCPGNVYGVHNVQTILIQNTSIFSTGYGVYSNGVDMKVMQSTIESTQDTLWQQAGTVTVLNSMLLGDFPSGTVTCVGVSHGTTFYASSCPT